MLNYSLSINAIDAMNLSLQFSEFKLPKSAVLSIYNKNELTDSITSSENNENNIWATRVYQGNILSIVLKIPSSEKEQVLLKIGTVNFGYKNFGVLFDFANPGASEPCHINANCPTGNNWNNEKNSVAMIVANGIIQCTGSLIMNTCNTNTPYFLTANHCLDAGNIPNWVFQFQTLSTDCDTNTGWREDIQFNGCTLRANNAATDFALLQLNTTPLPNSGIFYSGWSRQTTGNASTTILHHPAGDLMKISRDIDAPTALTSLGVDVWQLDLDLGRLQRGSSGAPYYNQNHQIIGQHWRRPEAGTRPICDITVTQGGRFDRSWTGGGTNATRLSNWLDSTNTGVMTTNTTNISLLTPPIGTLSIAGAGIICSGTSQFTLNNNSLPFTGNITWTSSNTSIATISPTGNPATVTKMGNGDVTLTASITNACGNLSANKIINVGVPSSPSITNLNYDTQCGTFAEAYSTNVSGATGYVWNLNFGQVIQDNAGQSGNYFFISPLIDNPQQGRSYFNYLSVQARNACGLSDPSATRQFTVGPVPSTCGGGGGPILMVAPNPAGSTLHVWTTNNTEFTQIRIFDKMGNLRKQFNYPPRTKRATLNIGDLPADLYRIQLFDDKTWLTTSFIKQ